MKKGYFVCFLLACFAMLQVFGSIHEVLEDNLDLRDKGIASYRSEKLYLHPSRLFSEQKDCFFLNDQSDLVPIRKLFRDVFGYYVVTGEPLCKNGHVGIMKVNKTWYCMEDGCEWFIGENF